MTRNVSIEDATVEITAGLYDTSEGFRAQVEGDDFPRFHATPQGEVKVGDGTAPPEPLASGGGGGPVQAVASVQSSTDLAGGDFTTVNIVDSFNTVVAADVPREGVIGLTVFKYAGDDPGVYTVTASGPCTPIEVLVGGLACVYGDTALWVGGGTGPGDGPTDPAGRFALTGPRTEAINLNYDNDESGLSASTVQGAIDELAATVAGLITP